MSVEERISDISKKLERVSETPRLDAQVLLADVLGVSRTHLLTHPEVVLTDREAGIVQEKVARLESGQAFPYVLGRWEFFGLEFIVNPAVLIPRPETELLVEKAISWLSENPDRRRLIDIGTGSGCIGISLAFNIPDLRVIAIDIARDALRVARTNRSKHHVNRRVDLLQADLFTPLPLSTLPAHRHDLTCANLPYIPTSTLEGLPVAKKEPWIALHGGEDGLHPLRTLFKQAQRLISEGGMVLLEIGAEQGQAARNVATRSFPKAEVEVAQDYAGHDRLLVVMDR